MNPRKVWEMVPLDFNLRAFSGSNVSVTRFLSSPYPRLFPPSVFQMVDWMRAHLVAFCWGVAAIFGIREPRWPLDGEFTSPKYRFCSTLLTVRANLTIFVALPTCGASGVALLAAVLGVSTGGVLLVTVSTWGSFALMQTVASILIHSI